MKNILSWPRRHPYISGVILVVLILIIVSIVKLGKTDNSANIVKAARGTVSQEVSVTGRVISAQNVDLAFEKTVKVTRTNVAVGDKVSAGQVLLVTENGDAAANLLEAEARLASARRGARPEQIQIDRTKVTNAEQDLNDARQALITEINTAYINADDSIHNKVDQFMSQPRGPVPKFNLNTIDYDLAAKVERGRVTMENLLLDWKSRVSTMDPKNPASMVAYSRASLSAVSSFLSDVASAVNTVTTQQNPSLSQTAIDGYRASVSSSRTQISASLSAIVSANEKFAAADSALVLARRQLDLTNAGSSAEDISAAEAAVQRASAEYNKTVIRAPINGVVSTLTAKAGEIIQANEKAISLISENAYQIETNIPESDIPKIAIGGYATVTLDAYGTENQFRAQVVSIDPGETITDGVASYKTKLQFTEADPRIRSGMTANVIIGGQKKENVITIPVGALFIEGTERFVHVKRGEGVQEVPVTIGLRGSDGTVEVVSGLEEGQEVMLSSTK